MDVLFQFCQQVSGHGLGVEFWMACVILLVVLVFAMTA